MTAVRSLVAVTLLACAGAALGADLGRLFFTPAQRATLDNARKQNIRVEIDSENERPAPVPQNVSVTGLVRRSDGKSTVWLNHRPITDRQAGGIRVSAARTENRVKLSVPESGRSVDLKVGQTVEIVSGTIQEGYTRRPASKPVEKPAPAAENSSAPVPNVTPQVPPAPLKSDRAARKSGARGVADETRDDSRSNSRLKAR